eukprot:scaffold1863_cov166-Ochromonas_danica.AAC.4
MSLDFALTQFYRVLLDDLLLIYDAYTVYSKKRSYGSRSLKEFSEVLADLTEVEAQNFDDIDFKKLSKGQQETVTTIIWDYIHSVWIRYLLDDASQFPFWSAKLKVFSTQPAFGMSAIYSLKELLIARFQKGKVYTIYEGFAPYLMASALVNMDYLIKRTNNFIFSILSKIPSPPSLDVIERDESHGQLLPADSMVMMPPPLPAPVIPGLTHVASNWNLHASRSSSSSGAYREKMSTKAWLMSICSTVCTTVCSHPNIVSAVHMVANPLCKGSPWAVAVIKVLTDYGIGAFYNGMKLRIFVNLLPFTSFLVMGIADNIIYRSILSVANIGHHHHHHIQPSSTPAVGAASYLTYNLLTAAHIVPSFLSFVSIRALYRMMFGPSMLRKQQLLRRKEIVEAFMTKIRKRSDSREKK